MSDNSGNYSQKPLEIPESAGEEMKKKAEEANRRYDEERERAVENNRFYGEFQDNRCHTCGVLTTMYFISKKRGRGEQCICCVLPEDLDDNIWTYDRFRVIMRPLYERMDALTTVAYRGQVFVDLSKKGAGFGGDCMTNSEGLRIERLIHRYTAVFTDKMKSANIDFEKLKAERPDQYEALMKRIHALDGQRPIF